MRSTPRRPQTQSKIKPGHVTLERALSKRGIASRTQARELILAGKIRVNGILRLDPGFQVVPEKAKFEVDGNLQAAARWSTFLLNKPRGVVTTRVDEKGRPTVFSLIPEIQTEKLSLHAVGRLDLATTGVLLLTNDTKLSAWLTDPANGVPRVYVVTVRGKVSEEDLEKLSKGVQATKDDQQSEETLTPDEVTLRKASHKESHLTVQLKEGKNREIRRMFLALGHEVTRLKRVSYGGLELGDLSPGEYREISVEELKTAFPDLRISSSQLANST